MDTIQLLANGGVVVVLSGILYKVNERRLKKLEVEKVNNEACELRHERIDETLIELKKITSATHDTVLQIGTALNIKEK